jgi:hypothetical protein
LRLKSIGHHRTGATDISSRITRMDKGNAPRSPRSRMPSARPKLWRGDLRARMAMTRTVSSGKRMGCGDTTTEGFLTSGRVGKYWVAFPYGFLNREAMDLLQLTPAQLRQAASLKERIAELEGELESILGTSATATPSRKLHWTQTPEGRARLARSVRRSWRTRRRS